jgi:hypothetical protein
VSTITVERTHATDTASEWRRLCHYYFPGTLRSLCGTASRQPQDDLHDEDECAARGHTICVVCTEIWRNIYPSE